MLFAASWDTMRLSTPPLASDFHPHLAVVPESAPSRHPCVHASTQRLQQQNKRKTRRAGGPSSASDSRVDHARPLALEAERVSVSSRRHLPSPRPSARPRRLICSHVALTRTCDSRTDACGYGHRVHARVCGRSREDGGGRRTARRAREWREPPLLSSVLSCAGAASRGWCLQCFAVMPPGEHVRVRPRRQRTRSPHVPRSGFTFAGCALRRSGEASRVKSPHENCAPGAP